MMWRVSYIVRIAAPSASYPTLPYARTSAEAGRSSVGRLDLQRHRDRLLRSACRLCGNETEAQDLVQETFLQALESARRFRGDSTVHTWLHGILLNLCHRHVREQKHERLVFDEELVLSGSVQPGSALAVDEEPCMDEVSEAVRRLSPRHREVIELRYYRSLKIHEIAERTGVSIGTIKSRLHYAIRCLEHLIPSRLNLFASSATHKRR